MSPNYIQSGIIKTRENIWIIGTLNCHGLNKPGEILAFSSLFRAMKADIMILTETWDNEVSAKSRKKALWMTNRIWTETSYDPNINRLRKGVTIAFSERIHKHLAFTEIPKNNNKDTGCLVKSLLSFRRNKIAIIGIYIPTNYQDKEDRIFVINKTIEWIRDSREKDNHMILAGDLNEWIFEKNRALSKLGKYIKRCSWLKEVWNQINLNINGSTFPLKDPNHKIDYIYISEGLINNVTQAATSRTQTDIGEDHSSLWCSLSPPFLQRKDEFKGIIKNPKLNIKYTSKETWEEYTKGIEDYLKNNKIWPESNISLDEVIYETGKKYFRPITRKDKEEKEFNL